MTRNGEKIHEFLEYCQYEPLLGCATFDHKYSDNGTISCVKCGKTKYD